MWEKHSEFWRTHYAIAGATRARQSAAPKGRVVASPSGRYIVPTLDMQTARWSGAALERRLGSKGPYAGLVKAGNNVQLSVKDPTAAVIRNLVAQLVPDLAAAYDRHLSPVATAALNAWPKASGFSALSLVLAYRQDGNIFSGTIGNKAGYTPFIKGNPWGKFVRTPAREAARLIAADLEAHHGR